MRELTFDRVTSAGVERATLDARDLVLAGWTGRDQADIDHHIAELAALGVKPPSRTPVYYRCAVDLVTQSDRLQVLGPHTSGEVEYVLLGFDDGIWVTVGSDQTDRLQEASIGIAMSKQLAGKVLATTCWRIEDVIDRWDSLTLKAWATIDGRRVPYQDTTLGTMKRPEDLIAGCGFGRVADNGTMNLMAGTVLMSGTPPAIGGVRPADRFEMELADPAIARAITAAYDIDVLSVVS